MLQKVTCKHCQVCAARMYGGSVGLHVFELVSSPDPDSQQLRVDYITATGPLSRSNPPAAVGNLDLGTRLFLNTGPV